MQVVPTSPGGAAYMCCSLDKKCIPSCLVCPLSLVIVHNIGIACNMLFTAFSLVLFPLTANTNAIAGEAIHQ